MKIDINFRSKSRHQLEMNLKTCTTRPRRLGEVGDCFFVLLSKGTKRYELTKVIKVPLGTVYHYYYKQEGYNTKEEFGRVWITLHPIRRLDMKWLVWLHLFEEI